MFCTAAIYRPFSRSTYSNFEISFLSFFYTFILSFFFSCFLSLSHLRQISQSPKKDFPILRKKHGMFFSGNWLIVEASNIDSWDLKKEDHKLITDVTTSFANCIESRKHVHEQLICIEAYQSKENLQKNVLYKSPQHHGILSPLTTVERHKLSSVTLCPTYRLYWARNAPCLHAVAAPLLLTWIRQKCLMIII